MTDSKTIAIDARQTLDALVRHLGSLDQCRRLGFVYEDDHGVMFPSAAGMAFLIVVVTGNVSDPAEAFAAGYQAAFDELS